MREPIEDICRYANEKWKLRLSKTLMCDNTWKNNASNKPNMKRRIYANNYDEEIFKGEYYASLNDNESFDQSHGSRHSDSHREDHEDPQHEYSHGDRDRDLREERQSHNRRSDNHKSNTYDRKSDER